uniref:F-box domain-containing protein n=1 Tax=Arion vulgaris TaxID=1028688 RepID=A0A0B7AW99_9EUPU
MAGSNDLEKFREEWKNEIQHHTPIATESSPKGSKPCNSSESRDGCYIEECSHLGANIGLGINSHIVDDTSTSRDADDSISNNRSSVTVSNTTDFVEYYPFKILTQFLNEAPQKHKPNPKSVKTETKQIAGSFAKRKYFSSGSTDAHQKKLRESQSINNYQKQEGSQTKNILDIFIADLDEINEIPFFDSTLPREVAIKIFQHLDMRSLCSCSQVSHSWRNLADDELLWCKICHSLGYDTDLHVSAGQGWKGVVRHHVQEKKLLKENWKARIGKPYNLNFARGGVLCAVQSHGSNIVAGYTSCNVRSWDTKTGDVCTFNASNTSLVLDESADDLGRIHNEIKHVATTEFITAASFRHGFVDVWRNEGCTDPIHTCTFRNPDITSLSVQDVDSKCSLVAASQGTRVQISNIGEEDGKCLSDFDMNTAVSQLDWLRKCQSSNASRLLITCHSSVYLKTINVVSSWTSTGQDQNITEVHDVIWAPVTSVGSRDSIDEVAVGFNFYAGPTTQIKVNIYDLNKNHLKATLTGHTWIVSCIFMPNSLTDQVVTGSGDRKIRLYDLRISSSAATTLVGHIAKITAVEMDDWKVVSGDEGGFVHVWDRRMCRKLWDVRNRHPVQYCHFDDRLLIIGNVPYHKFPEGDEFETVSSLRYRGTVQVYDFLANQQTQGIPDICLSSYSEPEAYDYNLGLAVPYDIVS